MNKKALIAVGVIAVLGIGTYVVIVNKNKNKTTSGGSNTTSGGNTTTGSGNQTWFCKYLNIGCGIDFKNPPIV